MHVTQFLAAEAACNRAVRAAKIFAEGETKADLGRLDYLIAEVRFFAVGWDECRTAEDEGKQTGDEARQTRRDLIQRLTTACAPGRL